MGIGETIIASLIIITVLILGVVYLACKYGITDNKK